MQLFLQFLAQSALLFVAVSFLDLSVIIGVVFFVEFIDHYEFLVAGLQISFLDLPEGSMPLYFVLFDFLYEKVLDAGDFVDELLELPAHFGHVGVDSFCDIIEVLLVFVQDRHYLPF